METTEKIIEKTIEKTIEIPAAIMKASNIKYDNSSSELAAIAVQGAIDEIKEATDAAQSTANTAKTNAEAAQKTANTAQSTAEAAQIAAVNANTSANAYTDEKIAALINGAPSTLDTLKEVADAMAESQDVVEALEQSIGSKASKTELDDHTGNKSNPHGVTKAQVGLGNVPNVATNDQTPTFTAATANANLTSGEKLSVAFGKIAKAISSLISHLANTSNPHSVTKSQVGLSNVDNTSDANKPVSTAQQMALDEITESLDNLEEEFSEFSEQTVQVNSEYVCFEDGAEAEMIIGSGGHEFKTIFSNDKIIVEEWANREKIASSEFVKSDIEKYDVTTNDNVASGEIEIIKTGNLKSVNLRSIKLVNDLDKAATLNLGNIADESFGKKQTNSQYGTICVNGGYVLRIEVNNANNIRITNLSTNAIPNGSVITGTMILI